MAISLETLRNTKGIGSKTLERIIEQHEIDNNIKTQLAEPTKTMLLEENSINCGDGVHVMRNNIPNESVDMVITSPPYDNLRGYKGYNFDYKSMLSEIYRVLKQGGVCVWVVGDSTINGSETGTSFKHALYSMDIGFNLHDTMIYAKDSPSYPANSQSVRYSQVFEYMFIFTKGKPRATNIICDKKNKWGGRTSYGTASSRLRNGNLIQGKKIKVSEYGARYNIWKINTGYKKSTKDDIAYQHPAIFPEQLAKDHILTWSNKGDIVLDPMCGSGTSCKMAKETGRKFIGIDISEEYCNIAKDRMKESKND